MVVEILALFISILLLSLSSNKDRDHTSYYDQQQADNR